jgi:hypothetical protein
MLDHPGVTQRTFDLRLPAELDEQLHEHALRDHCSANTVIVLAIEEYLNRHAPRPAPIDYAPGAELSDYEQRVQRSLADLEQQLDQRTRRIDPKAVDLDGLDT